MSWTRWAVPFTLLAGLATAAAAQDKQRFELKFEKDKPFYQKATTVVEQTLKVQGGSGADVPQRLEQTFFFKWTPVSVDKDKTVLKQTIEGLRFKQDIAGQTIDFDSTDPNPSGAAGNPGLTEFFKSLLGLEFTVTVGKNGVEKVDGREQALQKLAAVNGQLEAVLKRILTDEAVKEMTDPAAGLTPPAEQAVGGTWEKKSTLTLGTLGSYDRTYNFTYKGKDAEKKDLDRVEVKATVAFKPTTDAGEGLPFKVKGGTFQTKEQKNGVALFNAKAGRVESVRLHTVLTGDLELTVGGADTKVAIYQDQKLEVDTADTSLLPAKK